jgi:hypothetical protein
MGFSDAGSVCSPSVSPAGVPVHNGDVGRLGTEGAFEYPGSSLVTSVLADER